MSHFSDWHLEQYLLNELPEPKLEAIKAELAKNPELRQRLDAMEQQNSELMEAMPPQAFAKLISNVAAEQAQPAQAKQAASGTSLGLRIWQALSAKWLTSGMALACAVFAMVMFVPQLNQQGLALNEFDEEIIRIKGALPYFTVYKQSQSQGEKVSEQSYLRQGDTLQLSYVAAGHQYGYLFSIDGNGVVTEHLAEVDGPAQLSNEGEIRLRSAYQLDDAPKYERFFFISSTDDFDLNPVKQAINQLIASGNGGSDELPLAQPLLQSLSISSISFKKE